MNRFERRFTCTILGIFGAALMLVTLGGCATLAESIERPDVKLASITLLEAGLMQQVYGVTLQVDNPNGFALPIKSVKYAVKLAGHDFATGLSPTGFSIPANGSDQIKVEVRTNLLDSIEHLRTLLSGGPKDLDYELSGDIEINMPLIGPIPFSQSGIIPLTRASQ